MRDVGIVTFQNAINIGAFLQGYALYKIVEEYGVNVGFCYKLSIWKQKYDILAKKPLKLKFNIERYYKFCKEQKLLPTTNKKKFDILICGSDSIWDISEHTTRYIPEMFGVGYKADRKFSYAASFGTLIDCTDLPDIASESLGTFQKITVRDLNSQFIIKSLLNSEAELVPDPTLIYNFNEEKPCSYKNYILVYGDFTDKLRIKIRDFANKKNLKLLSVGTYNPWCDISIAVSPFEFLGYIHNASYIFTSMYHGSIFSLKYEKKFLAYFTKKRLLKAGTTFEKLGLADRIIGDESDIDEKMECYIDYAYVKERLTNLQRETYIILAELMK